MTDRAFAALVAALWAAPLAAQDATPVTQENLPGVYRAQVMLYAVTITIRPDGSMGLADLPAKDRTGSSLEGTWTLGKDGQFAGACKPEGKEEVTLRIDLAKVTLEELRKSAAVSLRTGALGDKAIAVQLKRVEDFDPERHAVARKPAKPGREGGDLARLLELLAGRCAEQVCEIARKAKDLYDRSGVEDRIRELGRRLEAYFRR